MKGNQIFLFFIFLGIAAFFGFLEFSLARVAVLQVQAESYATTTGRVSSAWVDSVRGSKGGVRYYAVIAYTYEVGGKSYRSSRSRYNRGSAYYNRSGANQAIQAHPPGSAITVFYNPTNPADALLSPGLDAGIVAVLFLLGGSLAMVLWGLRKAARDSGWLDASSSVAGGQRIISETMTTRVRLPRIEAGSMALVTCFACAAVAGLVIRPLAMDPARSGECALLILVLLTVGVYIWQRVRIASGSQDLVIDEAMRTVQLPLTYKRKERLIVPFTDVTSVFLEKVAHRGRYGVTYTYAPTLQLRDGTTQRLTDLNQSRAESLASWLREKLGVTAA